MRSTRLFRGLAAIGVILLLFGCALFTAVQTKTPLSPALVQQDASMAVFLLQSGGCAVTTLAGVAAPIVQAESDAAGNTTLSAISAVSGKACKVTVPSTALPVPLPANVAPTVVPVAPAAS